MGMDANLKPAAPISCLHRERCLRPPVTVRPPALVFALFRESTATMRFFLLALTFISSAFVPISTMPPVLEAFASVNPVTITVDALRALWLGAPAGDNIWLSLVWSLGLIAVFAPIAVSRYRRVASV